MTVTYYVGIQYKNITLDSFFYVMFQIILKRKQCHNNIMHNRKELGLFMTPILCLQVVQKRVEYKGGSVKIKIFGYAHSKTITLHTF